MVTENTLLHRLRSGIRPGRRETYHIAITAVVLIGLMSAFYLDKHMRRELNIDRYSYRPFHDPQKANDSSPAYRYVDQHVKANDTVAHTSLGYMFLFANKPLNHYRLRQKLTISETGQKTYGPFEKAQDSYFGCPIIDSVEKMRGVVAAVEGELWLVLDFKATWVLGPQLVEYIEQNSENLFHQGNTRVYKFLKKALT